MRQRNKYLIKTLGITPLECDELWSNVQKNKKILSPAAQIGLAKVMRECSLQLFQFYWNFINEFKRITRPAMFGGVGGSLVDMARIFYFQLIAAALLGLDEKLWGNVYVSGREIVHTLAT